jgi:hypothetical protein
MKFNEVKPFLMAGFTITDDPFQVSRYSFDGTNINYYGYAGYKDTLKVGALIERLDLLEKYGDNRFINWNIIGISDPQKLTRDQAEKLMDAGYKIIRLGMNAGYYIKKNGIIRYFCTNSNKLDMGAAYLFDIKNEYKLYDNEPVKQEIVTKPYQYQDRSAQPLLREPNELKDKLETYWKELIYRNSVVSKMSCVIIDDVHKTKEPQMNQSFAKIKPFVLAGFKFTFGSIETGYWYMKNGKIHNQNNNAVRMTIENIERDYEDYYLLPNQQDLASNLSYEQAKILVDAGYRVTNNCCGSGIYYKKVNGTVKYFDELYEGTPAFFTDKDFKGKKIIFRLVDDLPTMEKTMHFDFKKAMDYLKEGKKVTHDELEEGYVYITLDSDGDIVDKDGDGVSILNELIFSDKWKLYEPKKLHVIIDGEGAMYHSNENLKELKLQRQTKSYSILGEHGEEIIALSANNREILVKIFKDGMIKIDKAFIESQGYKLEVINA